MTTRLLAFLGLLALASACLQGHKSGFYQYKWDDMVGPYPDGTIASGDTGDPIFNVQFSFSQPIDIFGTPVQDFRAWGDGHITPVTDGPLDIDTFSLGQDDKLMLAAKWFDWDDLENFLGSSVDVDIEVQVLKWADQFDGNNDITGPHVCVLERWGDDLFTIVDGGIKGNPPNNFGFTKVPDEIAIVTHRTTYVDDTDADPLNHITYQVTAQVVFGVTAAGTSFAVMHSDVTSANNIGFATTPTFNYIVNGDEPDPPPLTAQDPIQYATICGNTMLNTQSNGYCTKPGMVTFELTDGKGCRTTGDTCGSQTNNIVANNINCRTPRIPPDTCHVEGSCTYTYSGNNDEFRFQFLFQSHVIGFPEEWAMVDNVNNNMLLNVACVFSASNGEITQGNNPQTVTLAKTLNDNDILQCGASKDASGTYTFTIQNYDQDEGLPGPASMVYKQGVRFYQLKCRPSDFKTEVMAGITVTGEPAITRPPDVVGRTCTLNIGNQHNYNAAGWGVYGQGQSVTPGGHTPVMIGTPIFLQLCFNHGTPFTAKVHPYGAYFKQCVVANTAAFNDKTKTIIINGCASNLGNANAFQIDQDPESRDTPGNAPFCQITGALRAARWYGSDQIHFRCTYGLCRNTAFFAPGLNPAIYSSCYQSCGAPDPDFFPGGRKKRQTEEDEEVQVASTYVIVVDLDETEAQKSCANETLAYTAIAVLVILLLVATIIAALLFMRLNTRRQRKA